ncbi:MAG: hypothetical protein AB1657_01420 [Candidatus Micrarchaeota archaeon]
MVELKGQYFSFDAIIGGVIFILTAMALFSYWYGITSAFDQRHELLAKEAFRVSEILFTPLSPGVAVDWKDAHINSSRLVPACSGNADPRQAFGSGYPVTIYFQEVGRDGGISEICRWGGEDYLRSGNVYRFRRAASYADEEQETSLGYVDIFVYEPPAQ